MNEPRWIIDKSVTREGMFRVGGSGGPIDPHAAQNRNAMTTDPPNFTEYTG
jgi:hypothetical protein